MPVEAPRQLLRRLFAAAVAAADPLQCLPPHLPAVPTGRTVVIGAGKAAARMAQAVEAHWRGPLHGIVITRYGHGAPCRAIEVLEAAHPVPDAAGVAATQRLLGLLQDLSGEDLVLCLLSGGGSALLTQPAAGVTLADKQAVSAALLASGAPIAQINCVRKHLSAVKGGRLGLAAQPARVVTLLISDVPGDDLASIASGPTVADPSTREQAAEILRRYHIAAPQRVWDWLAQPAAETPKPGEPALARIGHWLIATPAAAQRAAADCARAAGIEPIMLGDAIEGEARECAADQARQALQRLAAARGPCVLLSGGETTVTVRGAGQGGRNSEFALALALQLDGAAQIWALACDTDGTDGAQANAGAVVTPDTLARGQRLGLDARARLDDNDAYGFFAALGDLVITGPTLTNVNDFRAVYIGR